MSLVREILTDAAIVLEELDRLQDRLIAKDAREFWSHEYPYVSRACDR